MSDGRRHRRRTVLKGVGAAGAFALAGCTSRQGDGDGSGDGGTGTGAPVERSEPLRVGVLLPTSGDLASVGRPIRDAAILPESQLSDADLGFEIDLREEDTKTSPQAGIEAANALVNAGYPGVCGPASSGVNLQVSRQVFIPNQVVGCSPSSTSPAVTNLEDNDYIFRTAPSDALQGQVLAQVGAEQLGNSTAATMYVNNAYGQQLSESFASSFRNEYSGTVTNQVPFEKQKNSYTSELSTAVEDSPSMLVVIGYPASGVQLFRDYYSDFEDEGLDILVTDGLKDPKLPEDVGRDMSNVRGTAPLASGPSREAFDSLYMDEYDRQPGVFNAQAYDATAVLLLANAAAGENDGTAVRNNVRPVANPGGTEITPDNLAEGLEMAASGEEVQYAGASSSVDFDDNGDMRAVTYEYWRFNTDKKNNIERLDTIEFGA